uniref:Uncharacterized protein n=1 Tax=Arundo donax TaxID=35708 RepID=A0A0A8ZXF1_ARUDO
MLSSEDRFRISTLILHYVVAIDSAGFSRCNTLPPAAYEKY